MQCVRYGYLKIKLQIYECENVLQIAQTSLSNNFNYSQFTILSICLIEANYTGNHGARFTVNCNLRQTKLSGCEAHSYLII